MAILRPPPRGFAGGRSQVPLSEFGKVETVHAVEANSVDVLFPGKKFDLILCDIEGAEIDALKGMPETLKNAQCLGIEFMPHHLRNVSEAGVEDFLENLWDFQTLYSPRLKRAVHRDGFTALLTLMFENDAHDECLIFHKKRLAITKARA